MNTTTYQSANQPASTDALHAVAEFPVAWFQATPAYIVLRPVGAFLGAWFQATPAGIALRTLFH